MTMKVRWAAHVFLVVLALAAGAAIVRSTALAVRSVLTPYDRKWWLLPARYGPLSLALLTASGDIGVFSLTYGTLAAHDSIFNHGMYILLFMALAASNRATAQRHAAIPVQRFARLSAWGSRLGFLALAL